MRTKRELLEYFAEHGDCAGTQCNKCPYYDSKHCLLNDLRKIGAKAILRQNRKKKGPRVFDKSKILTCVTADKAKVGMKGYFADDLALLEFNFYKNELYELSEIYDENCTYRFKDDINDYALFYPIEEWKNDGTKVG